MKRKEERKKKSDALFDKALVVVADLLTNVRA